MDLSFGSLAGRFYRLEEELAAGQSLLDKALPFAFHTPRQGEAGRFHQGWCRQDLPFLGDLEEEPCPLGYADDGTGVYLLWRREDERSVPRKAVDSLAASMSGGRELKQLHPEELEEIRERAIHSLLQRAIPKTRILPVVATRGWVWVGRKSLEQGRYQHALHPIVGRINLEPLVWGPQSECGWEALSLASMFAWLDSTDGHLDVDVELLEIQLKGSEIRCRAEHAGDALRAAMIQMVSASTIEVTRLVFSVEHHGEHVEVEVDSLGVSGGRPPGSAGGLLHEQILRRFNDYRTAVERVGEVMEAAYKARSGDTT